MTMPARILEIEAAEAFLAAPKTLDGPPPPWTESSYGGEFCATWILLDEFGAPVGELRFTAKKADTSVASINVIFHGREVWRLDLDHDHVCHSNPHDAYLMGLDARVCGSHEHAWGINKNHLLSQDQWRLRYRQAIPPQIRRLEQGLPWLASKINLTLDPAQRGFDGPKRSDLFDRSGL